MASCARSRSGPDWEQFVAATRVELARVIGHVARLRGTWEPDLVAELVQEVYAKLLAGPALTRFQSRGRGSALAFLRAIAASTAHDYFKAQFAGKRGGGARAVNWDAVAPNLASAGTSPVESLLLAQIESCLASFAGSGPGVDRDLLIFQLHYRLGLSPSAIASIAAVGLTTKGVESALARMIRLIRQRLRQVGPGLAQAQAAGP